MPLADLLGIRARTASGAEVKAPTVRAFLRALAALGEEIHTFREAIAEAPEGRLRPEVVVDGLLAMIAERPDKPLEFVLEGLVPLDRLHGESAAREVVMVVLSLIGPSLAAMERLLKPIESDDELIPDEDDDVDPSSRRVLAVARAHHLDPMAVLEWPLGLYLDALAELERQAGGDSSKAKAAFDSIMPEHDVRPVIGGPTRAPREVN